MQITNTTRKKTLHEHPEIARTLWKHATGFMFRRPGDKAMLFLFMPARRVRMHMWFVWGSIDIIALDGQGKVVAMKERFRPWTFWDAGVTASAVLELPVGTIARSGTRIGDRVALPRDTIRG